MSARLQVFFAERPARDRYFDDGQQYVVGRETECDFVVEDDRVSRRHARLYHRAGVWNIADLESKNGTAVEGLRVTESLLPATCWVSFGGVPARFEELDELARERLEAARRDRWQTTQGLLRGLQPSRGRDDLLDRTLDALLALTEAERAYVLMTEPTQPNQPNQPHTALRVVRGREGSGSAAAGGREVATFGGSSGVVDQTLASGRPMVITDTAAVEALARRNSIVEGGVRSIACVPLLDDASSAGVAEGVLYADRSSPGSVFTELDVEMLVALAGHAALALAAQRLGGELKELNALAGSARRRARE